MGSVEELGEGLHSTCTDTSLSIPRPNPGRPLLRNIISNAYSPILIVRVLGLVFYSNGQNLLSL